MKVYVFGNEDVAEDNLVFKIIKNFKNKVQDINFIIIKPNEDLPFAYEKDVVIIDTVLGINKIMIFDENNLDDLILSPRTSVHDFDLGFQLKYLKKIGKLERVKIIGLPQQGKIDYEIVQSILRKLVAQDIQGS